MTRKCVQKLLALVLITFTTASLGYSQLLVPVVREINNSQDYVIVIDGRGGTNPKVLMKDGNASSFDFDPNDLNTYPRWKVNRISVNRGPNVKPLTYTTYMCTSNNEYLAYGKKGDNKMMTSKEYDKFWEKDETGKFKYDISDMYHFVYREYVEKDEKYIKLTYHSDNSAASTTQVKIPSWPSHRLKLVLVKL